MPAILILHAAAFAAAKMTLIASAAPEIPAPRADQIRARLADPTGGIVVVAHRGCHNPAPLHRLGGAPENSILALEHCVAIGVDVMEVDVLRSADGHLVMLHDETVDRTTSGRGRVATMTLAQLQALRLRSNLGGQDAPLTEERVATLDQMLTRAKGRILLNLDVKAAIYPEVIEAVVKAGGQADVFIKTEAGIGSPPLAGLTPYNRTPFMPILINAEGKADLGAILVRQISGNRPIGVELPHISEQQLSMVSAVARRNRVRLMINTLGNGFVYGSFGDIDALRDPSAVWGRLHAAGVSIFQTDEPEALVAFNKRVAVTGGLFPSSVSR